MCSVFLNVMLLILWFCTRLVSGSFQWESLRNCSNGSIKNVKKSTNFSVAGTVIREFKAPLESCLVECLGTHKCRFVTVSGTSIDRCTQYNKVVLSEIPQSGLAYVYDFCPNNTETICLPELYFSFDNDTVTNNRGATFSVSLDGHGLALHASATEKQWAILEEYTSDTCVLRPHLCPNGFTLAFYTKIRPPTGSHAGMLTTRSKMTSANKHSDGFLVYYKRNIMGYQILKPANELVSLTHPVSFSDKWIHIAMSYKDDLIIYHDGEQKPVSSVLGSYDHFNNVQDYFIAFGRMETNTDSQYCNCEIDEVQIFEVQLNGEEVKELFEYN